MIARRAEKALPGTAGPTVAQLLAEELVTEMVRQHIDVIGLIELERDVIDAVGGIADGMGAGAESIPAAALAASLIDQAFRKVEAEWRRERAVCATDECVCCAMEAAAARKRSRGGSGQNGDLS